MKKFAFLALLILLLSGCSTKFTYNNIDWLIYWYIDDYIEFTPEQEQIFDEKLGQWMRWHRQQELPKYLSHLDELISDVKTQQLSIERMAYHQETAQMHWVRLREHVAPDLVEMSASLSDDQVVYLFAALSEDYEEERQKFDERQALTEEKRQKKALKESRKNLSRWIGKLNEEQRQFLANSYSLFVPTRSLWLDYEQEYQQALRVLFATRDSNPAFNGELLVMLTEPERYRSDALVQATENNSTQSKEFMFALSALMTEKQQQRLIRQISDYREDIQDLLN